MTKCTILVLGDLPSLLDYINSIRCAARCLGKAKCNTRGAKQL